MLKPNLAWGEEGVRAIDLPKNEGIFGPQALGISGGVRMVYMPESESVVVKNLGKHAAFSVTVFDPVTGAKTMLPTVKADDEGSWVCPPPDGLNHDWVLILETK